MNTEELFEIVKQMDKENRRDHERIFDTLENIRISIAKIEVAVNGNGTRGLSKRMFDLENDFKQLRKKITTIFLIGIGLGVLAMVLQGDILKLVAKILSVV